MPSAPEAKAEPSESDIEARNLWALVGHTVSLRCGWIFKTEAVVMPAVLDLLAGASGASGWVRGLMPLLNKLGQSVPPLFAADLIKRRERKASSLTVTSSLMAIVFACVAGLWILRGVVSEGLLITAFLTLYAIFFAAVGLNGLAFNTVQGKLIRPERRGRLMGFGATIGSFAAIGLAACLMPMWLAWPNATGFVPIFMTSAAGYALAAMFCVFMKETPRRPADSKPNRPFVGVITLLKEDSRFRLAGIVAGLTAASQILFPHYQWIGREILGTQLTDLFWWVLAQNMTVAIAGPLAGGIGDRFGNRLALRTMVALSTLPPAVAGAILWLHSLGYESAAGWYWTVFCLLGLTPVTVRTILNYTLELASEDDHPRYVSTMQVCLALPFVFSPVAGLLVGRFEQPGIGVSILIAGVLATLALAFVLTFALAENRTKSP